MELNNVVEKAIDEALSNVEQWYTPEEEGVLDNDEENLYQPDSVSRLIRRLKVLEADADMRARGWLNVSDKEFWEAYRGLGQDIEDVLVRAGQLELSAVERLEQLGYIVYLLKEEKKVCLHVGAARLSRRFKQTRRLH